MIGKRSKSINEESEIGEALPYCCGKTVVIKYGGAAMLSPGLKQSVIKDIVRLCSAGAKILLVHGGGPELTALQKQLHIETRFVNGLRYTDAATMDAALMALCGKVNKDIVRLLENEGGRAAGISGIDGGILRCRKQSDPDLGFVGEIVHIETELLNLILAGGFIPVISTVGIGEDGFPYNINADTAAGRIAACFTADIFITLSDVPGVLRDLDDPSSLIEEIKASDIEDLIEGGIVSGGMAPKLRSLAEAVKYGARSATIADGREPHVLMRALTARAESENGGSRAPGSAAIGTTIIES